MFGIKESIDECQHKISRVSRQEIIDIANKVKYVAEFFVQGTSIKDPALLEDNDEN